MDGSQDFLYMGNVKRSYTTAPIKRSLIRTKRSHSEKTSPNLIQDDISVFSDDTFVISLNRRFSKSVSDLRSESYESDDLIIPGTFCIMFLKYIIVLSVL